MGVYYNYCAASAGSYCYAGSGADGFTTQDICPANWRMPTGGVNGEFSALAQKIYGSTGATTDIGAVNNYRNALSLPFSGRFYDGSVSYQGSHAWWWSGSYVDTGAYYLYISSTNITPQIGDNRCFGYPIRCIKSD